MCNKRMCKWEICSSSNVKVFGGKTEAAEDLNPNKEMW